MDKYGRPLRNVVGERWSAWRSRGPKFETYGGRPLTYRQEELRFRDRLLVLDCGHTIRKEYSRYLYRDWHGKRARCDECRWISSHGSELKFPLAQK